MFPKAKWSNCSNVKGLPSAQIPTRQPALIETIYKLDLPQTSDDLIDTALFLMRETASELSISDEAVGRERGVVLSEKQTRNSAGLRRIENLLQFGLPDAPYGNRLPIGTEEVLKTAPASRIKDFYRRYYRPENATMVVVGDFDVDAMEAKIKAKFSDWKPVGAQPVRRWIAEPSTPSRAFAVGTFSDPAVSTEIEMAIFKPFTRKDDSIAERKQTLLETLAAGIMRKRFQKLSLAEDAKIRSGSIEIGSAIRSY